MHSHNFLIQTFLALAGFGAGWLGRLFLLAETLPDSQSILAGGGLTVAGIVGYVILRVVDGYNARRLVREQAEVRADEAGQARRCDLLALENSSLQRQVVALAAEISWYHAQHGPGDPDALRRARQAALHASGSSASASEPAK